MDKKILIILILLFTVNLTVFSQDKKKIDSLLNKLKIAKEDTNKVNLLNNLAYYYSKPNPDSAFLLGEEAFSLSKKINYTKGKALSMQNIAYTNYKNNDFAEALNFYHKSLDYFIEIKDSSEITITYTEIAKIHYRLNNYDNAIKFMTKSLNIYEQKKDLKNISKSYNNLGVLYKYVGNYDTAIIFFQKALKIHIQRKDSVSMSMVYNNMASLYIMKNDYKQAEAYLQKSLEIKEKKGLKSGMAVSYGNLAELYNSLADSINSFQNYKISISYAKKSLAIAEEIDDLDIISFAYSYLMTSYKGIENYKDALLYSELYKRTQDSLYGIEKALEIENLQAEYDSEKINNENEQLKQNEILMQEHLQNQKYKNYILILGILFLLVFAIVMLIPILFLW